MRGFRASVLAVAAVALPAALATPAHAAGWGAIWEMNEKQGQMIDSSGNGNNSTSIGAGIVRGGVRYQFKSPAEVPSRGVVTVADKASLDPGTDPFSIIAVLTPTMGGDRNIVQKGGYTASGAQWKMEIVGNAYNCVFKGTLGDHRVGNATGVKNTVILNNEQTVVCKRTATHIQLWVNGQLKASKAANPGSIANAKAMTVGGKTDCGSDCDFFVGGINSLKLTKP